jgi:hypothetical protein
MLSPRNVIRAIDKHKSIDLSPPTARRATAVLTWCSQRVPRAVGRQPDRSPGALPWPDQCAVTRLARAWRRGGAPQDAPSCAAAHRTRALTPSWPRPALTGAHAAPWRGPSAGMRADRTTARPGMAGLTCCTGGKGHPENGRRVPAAGQVSMDGRMRRSSWSRPPKTVPGPASAGYASNPGGEAEPDPGWPGNRSCRPRCCTLLLYSPFEVFEFRF